jgi:hypothetical protein
MKRSIPRGITLAAFALLIWFLFLMPSGMFARSGVRKEASRILISVTVPVAPAPQGACAGSVAHCVTLTWTAPTAVVGGGAITGTLSYDVYRSTTSGSGYTKITTVPVSAAAYEDDNVVGGTTYFYVVVAYQTIGTVTASGSANSAQASATGLPIPTTNPPTGLLAVSH